MVKSCLSLIVFVASANCAHINFLGAPGYHGGFYSYGGLPFNYYGGQPLTYAGETISPSIYPLRSALDVLNVPAYATGFTSFQPTHIIEAASTAEKAETPVNTEKSVEVAVEAEADNTKVAPEENVVDVAVEEDDSSSTGALVPVKVTVGSLPAPPLSLFRDPVPPIPAGIAQATQPQFVLTPFKNTKVSPVLQFVSNSKLSPALQQIKEQSAGILIV